MRENRETELEIKEDFDCESMLDLEDTSYVEYPEGGNILITKRPVNT